MTERKVISIFGQAPALDTPIDFRLRQGRLEHFFPRRRRRQFLEKVFMCILSVSVRHRCNRPDFPASYLADLDGSCCISVKPTVAQSRSGRGHLKRKEI